MHARLLPTSPVVRAEPPVRQGDALARSRIVTCPSRRGARTGGRPRGVPAAIPKVRDRRRLACGAGDPLALRRRRASRRPARAPSACALRFRARRHARHRLPVLVRSKPHPPSCLRMQGLPLWTRTARHARGFPASGGACGLREWNICSRFRHQSRPMERQKGARPSYVGGRERRP